MKFLKGNCGRLGFPSTTEAILPRNLKKIFSENLSRLLERIFSDFWCETSRILKVNSSSFLNLKENLHRYQKRPILVSAKISFQLQYHLRFHSRIISALSRKKTIWEFRILKCFSKQHFIRFQNRTNRDYISGFWRAFINGFVAKEILCDKITPKNLFRLSTVIDNSDVSNVINYVSHC